MPTKSEIFVQEFVLGFGFLGGLFTWVGLDPEEELVRAFLKVAFPNDGFMVSFVIVLFIIASTAVGIFGTLRIAGKIGLLVVGLAWVSGLIILRGGTATIVGAFLLICVLIAGSVV